LTSRIVTLLGAVVCLAAAYGCYDFSRYIGPYSPIWGWVTLWAAVFILIEGTALVYLSLRRWR